MSALSKYFTLKSALYWHTLFFILAMLQAVPLLGISWLVINIFVFISLLRAVYGPTENKLRYNAIAWYIYTVSIFADLLSLCIFGQYMVNEAHVLFALVMAVLMLLPKPLFAYSVLKSLQSDGFDYKRGFDTAMPEPDIESQLKYEPPNPFINIVTTEGDSYQLPTTNSLGLSIAGLNKEGVLKELEDKFVPPKDSVLNLVRFNGQLVLDISLKEQTIGYKDMVDVVYGSCFLSSGGGGPLEMALAFVEEIKHYSVDLIKPNAKCITKDHAAVIVADLGSPQCVIDDHTKTLGRSAPINATKEMIKYAKSVHGKSELLVYPIEIGAANTIIPFYVAAKLGLSVMDADIAGRSVPYLTHTTLALAGIPCCPSIIATDDGNRGDEAKSDDAKYSMKLWDDAKMDPDKLNGEIKKQMTDDNKWKLPDDKMVVGLNIWFNTNPKNTEFQRAVNDFTLDAAKKLGKVFTDDTIIDNEEKLKRIGLVLKAVNGQEKEMYHLFSGNLTWHERKQSEVIDLNKIEFTNKNSKQKFVVYGLNENLIAYNLTDGKLAAMGPDGITFLDYHCKPIDAGSIKKYLNTTRECHIIGIECWNNMKEERYLDVMLESVRKCVIDIKTAFGDEWPEVTEYIPISELQESKKHKVHA